LGKLLVFSKKINLKTSIVSNGMGITRNFIEKYKESLDWIGLSLDSGDELIQHQLGRGEGTHVREMLSKSKLVKAAGINLKINSVINKLNYREDMNDLISLIQPNRWKVFQMLKIKGQNDNEHDNLLISKEEFASFIIRHAKLLPVVENNDVMIESYIMVDPSGRFYQNSGNVYHYSKPILEVGVFEALNEFKYNYNKFIERGGIYGF
jgi:radical S-adenosyl methionine domain-containing protein 2